jgi:hypothetical protein
MRRRDLFGRLATVAAVVSLAPAAKAEAAPQDTPVLDQTGLYVRDGEWRMAVNGADVGSVQSVIDAERADAYERAEFVKAMRDESRAKRGAAISGQDYRSKDGAEATTNA